MKKSFWRQAWKSEHWIFVAIKEFTIFRRNNGIVVMSVSNSLSLKRQT